MTIEAAPRPSGKGRPTAAQVSSAKTFTISFSYWRTMQSERLRSAGIVSIRSMTAISSARDAEAVSHGLKHFGVIAIDESDGMGVGVRLKFTRQGVKQIARLEGEGGIIGSDDAP